MTLGPCLVSMEDGVLQIPVRKPDRHGVVGVLLSVVLGGCHAPGTGDADAGQTAASPECLVHHKRMDCETDGRCVWAEDDNGEEHCLPRPPDCRVEGCPVGLTCAQWSTACLPDCVDPDVCCIPWHRCQPGDAGLPE